MQEKTVHYRTQCQRYIANADSLLASGEIEKAAELYWGAMAEAVKGVAARKGKELRQHREVRAFARGLAQELQDPSLWAAFQAAEYLHMDFYEVALSAEDVAWSADRVKQALPRLLELMEQPLP